MSHWFILSPKSAAVVSSPLHRMSHKHDGDDIADDSRSSEQVTKSRLERIGQKFLEKQTQDMQSLRSWERLADPSSSEAGVWILLNGATVAHQLEMTIESSPKSIAEYFNLDEYTQRFVPLTNLSVVLAPVKKKGSERHSGHRMGRFVVACSSASGLVHVARY